MTTLNRIDPVAQSFIIEEPTYLTKVDLYWLYDKNIGLMYLHHLMLMSQQQLILIHQYFVILENIH